MKEKTESGRTRCWGLTGVAIALATACLALASCNTMQGVGSDVQEAGQAIESTARDAAN